MSELSESPPPKGDKSEGYYPDPLGGNRDRYWDGSQWTTRVGKETQPASESSPRTDTDAASVRTSSPTLTDRVREAPTWLKITVPIVLLIIVVGALSPEEESSEPESDAGASKAEATEAAEPTDEEAAENCGTEATGECTPHVGPNGSVRVDALVWKLLSASTAESVGDLEFGLGEEADGVFVVAELEVTSDKDESATISDDIVQLEVEGGNTYDVDTDGTTAAELSGDKTFFLEDIGPDATQTGTVVFDVPPEVAKRKLELSFAELGFGSTKGYIALPGL